MRAVGSLVLLTPGGPLGDHRVIIGLKDFEDSFGRRLRTSKVAKQGDRGDALNLGGPSFLKFVICKYPFYIKSALLKA
jgi:hypothetical protein